MTQVTLFISNQSCMSFWLFNFSKIVKEYKINTWSNACSVQPGADSFANHEITLFSTASVVFGGVLTVKLPVRGLNITITIIGQAYNYTRNNTVLLKCL